MTTNANPAPQPMVSFIVTYYNLPVSLLCSCIDSILALSLEPGEREIIVVDDGSDLSPMNDLLKYGDDIIYVRQKNGGLSSARNKGLEVATGRYLQFVDADDLLIAPAFNHCLQILRSDHPEMVVFDFTSGTSAPRGDYKDQPVQTGSHYMRHNNIHGMACGYLFSRSILGDLRFTPGIYHEDEEFTPLLLLRAESLIATAAQAYCYQERTDSITNAEQNQPKRLSDFKDLLIRLHIAADRMPIDDKTALQRRVAQLTMDYLYQVIRLTHSRQQFESEVSELTQRGLFPLPSQAYTTKYTWFRRLSSTKVGRTLLVRLIPLTSKER